MVGGRSMLHMVQMHGDSRSFSMQHGARLASFTLSAHPLAILLCGCAPTRGFKQEGPASDTRLLGLATGRSVKTQQSLNVSASPSLFTSFQMPKEKKNLNSALVMNMERATVSGPHRPVQTKITQSHGNMQYCFWHCFAVA